MAGAELNRPTHYTCTIHIRIQITLYNISRFLQVFVLHCASCPDSNSNHNLSKRPLFGRGVFDSNFYTIWRDTELVYYIGMNDKKIKLLNFVNGILWP